MDAIKKTAHFVVAGERAEITFEARPKHGGRTIDLEPTPADAVEFSFQGSALRSAGQCDNEIRGLLDRVPETPETVALKSYLDFVLESWGRYHLGGMQPGTRVQAAAIPANLTSYDARVAHLEAVGLLEDRGYKYGTAWLYEVPPAGLIDRVINALDKLDGSRIGESPEVTDSRDENGAIISSLESADFSNRDDIIDSHDIIKRLEALADYLSDLPSDQRCEENYDLEADEAKGLHRADEVREYEALKRLDEQAANYSGDWKYGATLIRESYFVEYAEDFADNIGAVNKETAWPNNHIDWEAAAEELKGDYTEVDFDGVAYYVR